MNTLPERNISGHELILWNKELKIAVADIDETIADVYMAAEPAMINEINILLEDGVKLFMVTGGGLAHAQWRITDAIKPELRQNILISHCSGAEVWGFEKSGELKKAPFFSVYEDVFTDEMKTQFRKVIQQLLVEFNLRPHDARPKLQFIDEIGRDMHDIMLDDRGPQITFEMINAGDLNDEQMSELDHDVPITHGQRDLRIPVLERAEQLFSELNLPITPRLGGTFALDFAVKGVSKTTSIHAVLDNQEILATAGIERTSLSKPEHFEVWGDKFSAIRGGTDRHMSEALDPRVRSINFRQEDPNEFLPGYNTVLWNGEKHLHHGLLEYLQARCQ